MTGSEIILWVIIEAVVIAFVIFFLTKDRKKNLSGGKIYHIASFMIIPKIDTYSKKYKVVYYNQAEDPIETVYYPSYVIAMKEVLRKYRSAKIEYIQVPTNNKTEYTTIRSIRDYSKSPYTKNFYGATITTEGE